jgi:hypothetical protein
VTTVVWLTAGQAHLPGYSHPATTIGTVLVLIIITAGTIIA